jgi:hypothetical protein
LLGRRITNPSELADFHRRFMALDPRARQVVVTWELAAALLVSLALPLWVTLVVGAALVLRWFLVRRLRQTDRTQAHRADTVPSPSDRTTADSP